MLIIGNMSCGPGLSAGTLQNYDKWVWHIFSGKRKLLIKVVMPHNPGTVLSAQEGGHEA